MRPNISFILFLITFSCSSSETEGETVFSFKDQTIETEPPYSLTDYTLQWSDEFEYEGLPDSAKWYLQTEPITESGWANDELQHYTDRIDNARVSNGTLKIVAKAENFTSYGLLKRYTSARITSKYDFQYGLVEVRAKLPSSTGTWPAIWTLGSNIDEKGNYFGDSKGSVGWPHCGEIDIMEQYGGNKIETLGTFHWHDTGTNAYATYGLKKSIPGLTENFHNFVLVWDADRIDIYVDETLVVRMNNTQNVPFDNPHYLLLNVAMGGSLGGAVPTSFQQDQMEIDYVRIYQLKN